MFRRSFLRFLGGTAAAAAVGGPSLNALCRTEAGEADGQRVLVKNQSAALHDGTYIAGPRRQMVFLNGLLQMPDLDYRMSGTQVVLTVPMQPGDQIYVC